MSKVILCDRSDTNEIVEDERLQWIIEILIELGVDESIIENYDNIENYRYEMENMGIEIDYNISSNAVNVYKKQWHDGASEEESGWFEPNEDHLIAQWNEPNYVKRIKGSEVYYELHLNEWSIFNMRE